MKVRDLSEFSDEELMVSIVKGDKSAFHVLYGRYSGPMKGYFKKMLWNDNEKSEDFVHDLFAKIIRNPKSFDSSRKFKTWFYSVANNMCKNEYKKQEVRKNTTSGLDHVYAMKDNSSDVIKEVTESLFKDEFNKSLNLLDEKHKSIFLLRHVQGLSVKEIASSLLIKEGTVKSRLYYATKYLSQMLEVFNPILNQ